MRQRAALLADLDEHLVPRDAATDVLRHAWQVVDMAHVRWAAGSGITALDLCAAALGRLYCGIADDKWDLSVESARDKHWETLTTAPGEPSRWIAAVRGDHRYKGLLQLRPELTHRVRPRSYSVHVADAIHISDRAGPWSPEDARAHAEAQAEAEARASAASVTHRTRFVVGDRELSVPQVVRLARDLATRHVEAFLALDPGSTRVP
jgi:ketosteroid isomerase-like protein